MSDISNKTKILVITAIIFLLSGIVSSADEGMLLSSIKHIPEEVISFFVNITASAIEFGILCLKEFIMWNPNPDDIRPMVSDFIEMLIPVYVMIITILGVYIIFLSISPSGRARAKSMFWRTILSMVLVSISLEIFKIALAISEALAHRMLAGIVTTRITYFASILLINGNPYIMIFILQLLLWLLIFALVVVAVRYFLVLMMCAIFPFTLFLYFFEFTKDIGSKLLRYSMAIIFTQPVQALMLAITIMSMNSIGMAGSSVSENMIYAFLFMAGCSMIILAPLMMMGLLKWIGGAIAGLGMVVSFINPAIGGAMVAIGGVAAGMGPGGLIAGGTAYGLGTAYRGSLKPRPSKAPAASTSKKGSKPPIGPSSQRWGLGSPPGGGGGATGGGGGATGSGSTGLGPKRGSRPPPSQGQTTKSWTPRQAANTAQRRGKVRDDGRRMKPSGKAKLSKAGVVKEMGSRAKDEKTRYMKAPLGKKQNEVGAGSQKATGKINEAGSTKKMNEAGAGSNKAALSSRQDKLSPEIKKDIRNSAKEPSQPGKTSTKPKKGSEDKPPEGDKKSKKPKSEKEILQEKMNASKDVMDRLSNTDKKNTEPEGGEADT